MLHSLRSNTTTNFRPAARAYSQRYHLLFRSRGKLWSCYSGERMFSVFYQQDLTKALFIRCLFMQRVLQVPCNGRPSLLSRLAKKAGSVGNTRPLPHANMPLVPMNCFLCRVDYALEENVLTEQM